MSARLVLADEPGAWIDIDFGGRPYSARIDPMWLGAENLAELFERPQMVRQLFKEADAVSLMIADPFGHRIIELLEAYLDAVGLGFQGLGFLFVGLENLDLLEVDLLRIGLDIRDWLDPEKPLSSRRVALLIADFKERPETRIGAKSFGIYPADKATIVAAEAIAAHVSDESYRHRFLKSPDELADDVAKIQEAKNKREAIAKQQVSEIVSVPAGENSFVAASEKSQAALSALLASQGE